MSATAPTRAAYSVAWLPFFRWAIAIVERPDLPAIPFYRKASALVLRDECRALFPERTVVLLRRRFGRVEEVA